MEIFIVYNHLNSKHQECNARKVNCSCVHSAYILKPVLFGRNLYTRIYASVFVLYSRRLKALKLIILIIHIIVSYEQNISLIFLCERWIPCQAVTSVLCLHYRPETVHCSTKDMYTSEITFLALHPWSESTFGKRKKHFFKLCIIWTLKKN